jgi:Glycosyl hydrolase family 76
MRGSTSEAPIPRRRRVEWLPAKWLAAAVITCVATVTAAVPALAATPSGSGTPTVHRQAVLTYNALQSNFYKAGKSLYLGAPSSTCGKFSCLWPFTNATAGTLFLYGAPRGSQYAADVPARIKGLAAYADANEVSPSGAPQPPAYESAVAPPLGPGGSTYYDDNAWVGLNLIHAYLLTSASSDLTLAQDELNFAVSGWDTNSSDPCPGGVFWEDVANSQRNATANGGNAELGLELYRLTGNTSDLTWATSMYQWVVTCLGTSSSLYDDHVNPDGSVNTTIWSYNQGVMVGAGVLLYDATGNSSYLDEAEQTAAAAVSHFGTGTTLDNQGPAFNAIYFRDLFLLDQIAPDPSYASEAQSFATTMWGQRQAGTGLIDPQYGVNGSAPMVEIFSLLAGSPPAP